jgi:hypothetical protein
MAAVKASRRWWKPGAGGTIRNAPPSGWPKNAVAYGK